MLVELVGAAVVADVATWCFKNAAKAEIQSRHAAVSRERAARHDAVRRERAERREIERETRRRLYEEARQQREEWHEMLSECMDSVWEMRNRTRGIRTQFLEIVRANQNLIKTSPLTFQQREAIEDCIFHLERGIARLYAYSERYLQRFIDGIGEARKVVKHNTFIEPEMPASGLPDDFPVVGDLLRLNREEVASLARTGRVALGCGQLGRLSNGLASIHLAGEVEAFVEDYDQDSSCWKLSLARRAIVSRTAGDGSAIEATLLSLSKGGFRSAWHSPYCESIELFLPFALVDPATRSAPWGTQLPVFVHQADYRARRIVVGQRRREPRADAGDKILLATASAVVRGTIQRALEVSPSTFWLSGGPQQSEPADATLFMRVATGEEFPVSYDHGRGVLCVGEQSAYRLGDAKDAICRSYVEFHFCDAAEPVPAGSLDAVEFLARIRHRLGEQEELQQVFREETLETRKYQLLLEAELEASKSASRVVLRYTSYHPATESEEGNGEQEVTFQLESAPWTDLEGYAVQVLPPLAKGAANRVCGFVSAVDPGRQTVTCAFSDELLRPFLDRQVADSGTLECNFVDSETQRQVRALEQFRNVSFLQGRSAEDREAFRNLRRVLLGLRGIPRSASPGLPLSPLGNLNADQERAVRLVNSENPLTLVMGPPGTGKTDTIAIALEVFLRRNPGARVAVVSQANVAVNEALAKLKSRFPDCDVLWEVSEEAKKKFVNSHNEYLIQDARRDEFLRRLAGEEELPEWAANLRERFRRTCDDQRFLGRRVTKALVHSSSVYGCTLSILARLSLGSPLFDIVVVDEAAKASLPECMIAALAAKRLVLVGDHHQLLPFLDERILERAGPLRADQQAVQELWNNSLFKRMWGRADAGVKVLLTAQYRSRSGIRDAISNLFYEGKLTPGRTDESKKVPLPCSLVWLDTRGGREDQRVVNKSLVNEGEVAAVLDTLDMLARTLPHPTETSVAVICFYGEQRAEIERAFRESPVSRAFKSCEARTVDASQGGQWDVVLLSLTRCDGGFAFVGNANRLNVALSRARELAVVIGSLQYALGDRGRDSKLGALAEYVRAGHGRGVWIWTPGPRGGIAPGFGMRVPTGGGDGHRR